MAVEGEAAASRERAGRRPRRALAGSAATVAAVTAAGALLAAPGDLAAVRLLGVALGWWAAVGALVVVLAALMLDRQDGSTHPGPSRG